MALEVEPFPERDYIIVHHRQVSESTMAYHGPREKIDDYRG
jgi:hypothetical protein